MYIVSCGICGKKEDYFSAVDDGWNEYGPPTHDFHCPECSARDPRLNLDILMRPVVVDRALEAAASAAVFGAYAAIEKNMYRPRPTDEEDERLVDAFMAKRRHRGFDGPEDGSEKRYIKRRRKVPWASHTFWWVVHNAVAHLAIAFCPVGPTFRFHDWTSRKMHGKQ